MDRLKRHFPLFLATCALLTVGWGLYAISPWGETQWERSSAGSAGWSQTSGPLGGTVIRMINANGKIWASLYSGGIYELQKSGSWKQIAIDRGIPENRAFDIVPDPKNANIAYVPEMIACGGKTADGGSHWTGLCDAMLRNISADNFSAHTLALDPQDSNIVYIPGNTHDQTSMLVVSKDGGKNWEKRHAFDQHEDFNHLVFFNGKMYLGTMESGVLVSSDKGKSWVPLNKGLKAPTTTRFLTFKNTLYLLGGRFQFNTREGGDLYRLKTDGSQWERVSGIDRLTGMGTDGSTLIVGSEGGKLWTSGDGRTFSGRSASGLPVVFVGEIVFLQGKLYVGSGGDGVYLSTNGGKTFREWNKNLTSVATREVHVHPQNEQEMYVGTWDRLGFSWSIDGGKKYKRLATDISVLTLQPDPQDFSKLILGGDRFFVGSVSSKGSAFTERAKPGSPASFIKSLAIDPRNPQHFLAGVASDVAETPPGEGLWQSKDQGKTWTKSSGIADHAVYSILFHPKDSKMVYASALGAGVYKSTDGGSSFSRIGGDSLKYTYRLAMSPGDPNVLVAGSHLFFAQLPDKDTYSGKYGGLFQSSDGGATWKELTKGIRHYEGGETPESFQGWLYNFGHMPNYEMVLINPKDPNHLIVGHHGENVVITRDGGQTWEKPVQGMIPNNIHNYAYCLGSSSVFQKIYACTCGRGLFSGALGSDGRIVWDASGIAYAEDVHPDPGNAKEALQSLLSGEYNHPH